MCRCLCVMVSVFVAMVSQVRRLASCTPGKMARNKKHSKFQDVLSTSSNMYRTQYTVYPMCCYYGHDYCYGISIFLPARTGTDTRTRPRVWGARAARGLVRRPVARRKHGGAEVDAAERPLAVRQPVAVVPAGRPRAAEQRPAALANHATAQIWRIR